MAYRYSKKTIVISKIVEIFFYVVLYPVKLLIKTFCGTNSGSNNLLIVEPFQLGDVVSLSVMFDPIKDANANYKINLLIKNQNATFYENDPRVSKIFGSEFPWSDYDNKKGSFKRWRTLLTDLISIYRNQSFELGIDTRGDIRSQIILFLLCNKVIGYQTYLNSNMKLSGLLLAHKKEKSRFNHRYEINKEILELMNISYNDILFPTIITPQNETTVFDTEFVLVHIGGGWRYKKWGTDKWAELIYYLSNNQENIKVIAGEMEIALLQDLEQLAGFKKNVHYQVTSFDEMISLLFLAKQIICLDSGPMNIAVCLGKKNILALFGPGDSETWYPYYGKYIHKKDDYPCNPCKQKICYYPINSCMNAIQVDDVIKKM